MRTVSTTSASDGMGSSDASPSESVSAWRTSRNVGYKARAQRPPSCMTPSPWVKRLCSAVGKTQRALCSWLMRRSRWTQGVSSRSASATVSGGSPARALCSGVKRLVSSMYPWIGSLMRLTASNWGWAMGPSLSRPAGRPAYWAARSMTSRSGPVSVKTRMQAGPVNPATHSLCASKSPAWMNWTRTG